MLKDGTGFDEALFTDDSGGNINSTKEVCNTLLLPKKKGLDGTDCAYKEALVSTGKVLISWNAQIRLLLSSSKVRKNRHKN